MTTFKCPVCGNRHVVNDRYDNSDYVCDNGTGWPGQKLFDNLEPTDLMTTPGYLHNRHSTKIDEARPTTILVKRAKQMRSTGEPEGTNKTNY